MQDARHIGTRRQSKSVSVWYLSDDGIFTGSLTFASGLQVLWPAERDAVRFGGTWPANHARSSQWWQSGGRMRSMQMSRKALDQLLREAQAAADEPLEESGNTILRVDSSCTDCCMKKMIANQQDFRSERPLIQLIIEEAGHKCWFLPKFHCELNPIEMYWGWVKAHE
jgi:hypothetical protein